MNLIRINLYNDAIDYFELISDEVSNTLQINMMMMKENKGRSSS